MAATLGCTRRLPARRTSGAQARRNAPLAKHLHNLVGSAAGTLQPCSSAAASAIWSVPAPEAVTSTGGRPSTAMAQHMDHQCSTVAAEDAEPEPALGTLTNHQLHAADAVYTSSRHSAARAAAGGPALVGMPALARLRTWPTSAPHARHKTTDATDAAQAGSKPFQSYPSLLPSRDAATVAARLMEIVADAGMVDRVDTNAALATPKLHGSNLQLYYSQDDGLKYGRRGAFLKPGEDHYGALDAGAELALDAKMPTLFSRLAAAHKGLTAVVVFGEVYGGSYPHPSVPPAKPARKAVQKRVWYSTHIRIAGFDVRLDFADGRREFMPFDDAKAACDAEGIPFVPVVKRGPLAEVCQWAVDHAADDALAHYNPEGLPLMEPGKNAGEGFVVRFAQEVRWGDDRAVAKLKNPSFAEVAEGTKKEPGDAPAALDPAEQLAREIAAKYINVNRAAAVASKLSEREVRVENMKALADALAADARADPTMQPHELAAVAGGKGAKAFNMKGFLTGKA